ncbi:hypothetical protein [Pararhodospirillum photometricum]|nr:hypothetical protein [Pararhodospirillum photometricum]
MAHRVLSGLRSRGPARSSFVSISSAGAALLLLAACASDPTPAPTVSQATPTLPASAATTPTQVAAASSAPCHPSRDDAAIAVRALQSHLMVAGLSCGQSASYNQFVTKFQSDLASHGQSLTGYYSRQYGGKGANQLNTAVTRMANEAATRFMQDRSGYCGEAQAAFEALQAVRSGGLVDFVVAQHPFAVQAPACSTATADNTPITPTKGKGTPTKKAAKAPEKKPVAKK